ncbi:hypothetical protein HYQ46_003709 [Verticillium longisporum]|nr:hypothetical protein HYQ46_003709 [Verticillium longisporum]
MAFLSESSGRARRRVCSTSCQYTDRPASQAFLVTSSPLARSRLDVGGSVRKKTSPRAFKATAHARLVFFLLWLYWAYAVTTPRVEPVKMPTMESVMYGTADDLAIQRLEMASESSGMRGMSGVTFTCQEAVRHTDVHDIWSSGRPLANTIGFQVWEDLVELLRAERLIKTPLLNFARSWIAHCSKA